MENKWIDMQEQRPEIATRVIAFIPKLGAPYAGFRAVGGWYIFINDETKFFKNDHHGNSQVTHWMQRKERIPIGEQLEKICNP